MMKKISRRDFLKGAAASTASLALSMAFLDTSTGVLAAEADSASTEDAATMIALFKDMDPGCRPMLRFWMPDAGATYEELEIEMTALSEAGFGGVEIGNVPHNTYYDNNTYGWGSDNWLALMTNVLAIAEGLGDFEVDFTITAHWPAALNTIDPNDAVAGKETASAACKVTADMLENVTELPFPEIKTEDTAGNAFIFKYDLIAAVVAQVEAVDENGSYTLSMDSMAKVETTLSDKTTVAGIPMITEETSVDDADYVKSLFDGEEPDTSVFFTDSTGAAYAGRVALDDVQNYYTVDLSSVGIDVAAISEGEEIQAGDYVLFGLYSVGTGETPSDNNGFIPFQDPMPAVTYTLNLFSEAAAEEIISYWSDMLDRADELGLNLRELMQNHPGSIFEDSLENDFSSGTVFWSEGLEELFSEQFGYDIATYLPILTARESSVTTGGGFGEDATEAVTTITPGVNNSDTVYDNISTDFTEFLSDVYISEHVRIMNQSYAELVGWTYRGQGYHTNGLTMDTSAISAELDRADGESLAWSTDYDRFRAVAGGVHLAGKKYISDEALANMMETYQITWESAVSTINTNYVAGVNRIIIHGTSYSTTVGGLDTDGNVSDKNYNAWPGWHTFGSVFADPWGSRMAYWDDVNTMTDYMTRPHANLQNVTPNMDLLVYDLNTFKVTPEGENDKSALQTFLNNGFSYDVTSTDYLDSDEVANIGYKAIIVNNLEAIPVEGAEKLLAYAQSGMPVIFLGQTPSKSMSNVTTDEEIQDMAAQILEAGAVEAADQDEVLTYFEENGIRANAAYSSTDVRTISRKQDDGTVYYFVLNNSEEDKEVALSLTGGSNAYTLDAWTGEIAQISKSVSAENGVDVVVNLESGQATIVAATNDIDNFPAVYSVSVVSSDLETYYDADGNVVVRATESGSYTTELTDGDTTSTVDTTLEVAESVALTDWDLSLESWGPDEEINATDPDYSKKTTVELEDVDLVAWMDLAVDDSVLETLGVTAMSEISGIGTYTTTFDGTGLSGAYLVFTHGDDMITDITVNGESLGNLDPSRLRFDIGEYMADGENTVSVKVVSTMNNRVVAENDNYNSAAQSYGLTSVTLVPYAEAVVEM
ncbi:MAG: twin-arginine translocation signal domain-containing protein [Lachnospiraceae bacterium]|nr:twin-arginine translocation signal domain-containing protein [Lachnospiraceae bacterium]